MGKKNQAVQFSTVAKVLLVSLFLGGSGVGYVLQKGQIRALRMERDKNTTRISRLVDEVRQVDALLVEATRSQEILRRLEHFDIQLHPTSRERIVTVTEPDPIPPKKDVKFAGQ